jgi:hypothetical protein
MLTRAAHTFIIKLKTRERKPFITYTLFATITVDHYSVQLQCNCDATWLSGRQHSSAQKITSRDSNAFHIHNQQLDLEKEFQPDATILTVEVQLIVWRNAMLAR